MIVFLTDFGEYVNVLKGVIASLHPGVQYMDLSNSITPFSIVQGAWVLLQQYHYFPKGSIFVCVVDPGVGSDRKGIIIQTKDYVFIGPDNGLMHPAAKDNGIYRTFAIDEKKVQALARAVFHRRHRMSKTFHGRDIFALVAASLENEYSLDFMGKVISINHKLDLGPVANHGQIVDIDRYGNVITNIASPLLSAAITRSQARIEEGKIPLQLRVNVGKTWRVAMMCTHYDAVQQKKGSPLLALINSQGVLELAKRQASAASMLRAKLGGNVSIDLA